MKGHMKVNLGGVIQLKKLSCEETNTVENVPRI